MRFTKKVLKNGLRVITVPMKDNPTATVLVLVEAGSKYETKKINGLSHFLEHMCFKGTIKRPKAIDISKELDALGSQYNAFTAQEYTGYYAKSDARHFSQIFDVISDIYLNSTFPEIEMQKEKGVIIEEINMYEDMPNRHVQDLMMQLLYGNQPAGWNITGQKKNILNMKRDDFVKYKRMHYLPEATVIIVAGQITEKNVLKEVNKVFAKIPRGMKAKKLKTKEIQRKPEILVSFKKTDQTHFVLGVRSYDLFDKKNAVLSVLAGILGGGMSSRLFQKLREEMGVGYYVRAYNDAYTDHGFLQISAGVDNKRINEVVEAVLLECKKLKNQKISKEELNKVKEFLVGNMKLSLESSDDIAGFYGLQELLKHEIKEIREKANEIKKVTVNQVQILANHIFKNNRLNLALIGPSKSKMKFLKILRF
ncbi:MAG: Peptidase M16 domain protein [Candidatus Nomurabacteria bacterium GW2011_GWF2_35_12]|uniref:Peptidase M16 domain protein n=3 Tax=Candidatus Nomuraibacteriota TaxID=1752729 RepID=A0A0G0DSH3_9BACT|nr:MAG: Peptidase M16 domain protein [Candidatus Nomurabacteria bacterium GW2011_GWF2_35_12]KKP72907.1 MAG: Peptidase M16 domain protein [Candidatus Nomurabacteria bacterium GW2011_GWB1_35_20]KKP74678.1 MAG: Peptidase M16 domain protein [Parcubacteria group bacterium GW2011_GWC1_35_21]KKP77723.1 MAG: Peptidase M16 domain protein [Candidatus Nomurabacteria bacterium GW2011_GWC2_35_35]KKP88234.1 MAG: Peptidase M16 domain protein [Candidatus Nomurabacteria bacterium GW2011_GWA2_35_80]KKP97494.1 M